MPHPHARIIQGCPLLIDEGPTEDPVVTPPTAEGHGYSVRHRDDVLRHASRGREPQVQHLPRGCTQRIPDNSFILRFIFPDRPIE